MNKLLNIIRADIYKLIKSKVLIWDFLGLIAILLIGNLLTINGEGLMTLISDTQNLNQVNYSIKGSAIMPELLKGSNILVLFLIPIVINVFISDFRYATIKNNISHQYTRASVYIAKLLICSLFAIIVPIFYVLMGLILNMIFNGSISNVFLVDFINTFKIILNQIPLYIGFESAMILIGVLFQSNLATAMFTILYQIIIIFITSIVTSINISEYDPITCLDKVAYINDLNLSQILGFWMIGITLMIVTMCLGIYLFNKKDF